MKTLLATIDNLKIKFNKFSKYRLFLEKKIYK